MQRGAAALNACLKSGTDLRRARLLLRFCAALVVTNVLHASSVLATLQQFVEAALALAQANPGGDGGQAWQPYADHLVYMAVLALPFGGPELADTVPEELRQLVAAVDRYMELRPCSSQPELRPFSAAIKEEDAVAE